MRSSRLFILPRSEKFSAVVHIWISIKATIADCMNKQRQHSTQLNSTEGMCQVYSHFGLPCNRTRLRAHFGCHTL